MSVDPVDDCTFFYTNEYLLANGTFNWSTRIATFRFPSCGGPLTPDFSINATPSSGTVNPGTSATYTVAVTPSNGFSGTVNFSVSGSPAGAGGSFNPAFVVGSGSSTLTVSTSASTPAGSYSLAITGSSGSLTHTVNVTLVVNAPPPDFAITAVPASRTIVRGNSTTYGVTVTPTNGFNGSVGFSVSGLPSGAAGSFNPVSVVGSGSSTLTVSTSTSTPTGSYSLAIKGSSGSLTHTINVTLVVTAPNFAITVAPTSRTVVHGSSTTYSVTVTPSNGFSGTVNFSVSGLPSGAAGSFNPASVVGSGSSTLTVSTSTSTPAGTYSLTIKGTSGSLVHRVKVTLVVQ
jgi:hypothetical protein